MFGPAVGSKLISRTERQTQRRAVRGSRLFDTRFGQICRKANAVRCSGTGSSGSPVHAQLDTANEEPTAMIRMSRSPPLRFGAPLNLGLRTPQNWSRRRPCEVGSSSLPGRYRRWYGAFWERSVGAFGERGADDCAGASTILACEGSPAAGLTVSTSPPRLRTILPATVKHMVRYGFSPSSTRTSRLPRRSLRPFFAGGKPRFSSIDSACD
jgi:hypothetical protein